MHRLICILLLICLPLQSFAVQGSWLPAGTASGQGIAHVLAHADNIAHHHDGDGSVHYDDSDESVHHIQDSCAAQAAYLAEPFRPIAPVQLASEAGHLIARYIPDPFLDSPLRPPALSLG